MNKNYALLKFSVVLFVMLTCLVFSACKKELYVTEKIDPKMQSLINGYLKTPKIENIDFEQFKTKVAINALGTLKSSFVAEPTNQGKLMNVNLEETYTGFALNTDSIKMIKVNGHTSYIFSVKLASKRAIIFQNLTIDESSEGTHAFITTYIPNKKWLNDRKHNPTAKFEGKIGITSLDLKNGKILNVGESSSAQSKEKISAVQLPNQKALNLVCTTVDFYYNIPYPCAGGGHWPGDNCPLSGNERAGYFTVTETITSCNEQPGGEGGGGGTSPNTPPGYDPCDGITPPPAQEYNDATGGKLLVHAETECDSVAVLPMLPPVININLDVIENLQDSCRKSAFNSVTNQGIKNYITQLYSKLYLGANASIDLKIKDAADIKVSGYAVPAFSTFNNNTNSWEITISSTYYSDSTYNMSKEAWGQIIIHEILHGFIFKELPNINHKELDHLVIFKNYVGSTKELLVSAFGMSESDALGMALTGIKDLWGYSDFEQLSIDTYGKTNAQVDATYNKYFKGTGGTKCH